MAWNPFHFRRKQAPSASARPRSYQPAFELLERRELLSGPFLSLPTEYGNEGESFSISIMAGDSGTVSVSLSFSASGLPPGLAINSGGIVSGYIAYSAVNPSPPGGFTTFYPNITVSDVNGTANGTFTWTVVDVNRLPGWNLGYQTTAEGQTVSLDMQGTDNIPTDSLTYSASGLPPGLSINATSGLISGTIPYNALASGTLSSYWYPTVTLVDQNGGLDRQSGTWDITATELLTSQSLISIDEGAAAWVNVGSALLSATVTYSETGLPPGLSINASSGLITGTVWYTPVNPSPNTTPTANYAAVVTAEVGTASQSETVSWKVTDTNRLPSLIGPYSTAEGQTLTVNMSASDDVSSDAPLSYSASGLPPGLSINTSSGMISGTVGYNAVTGGASVSVYTPTVTLTDSHGGIDHASFSATITNTPILISFGPVSNVEGAIVSHATAISGGPSGLTYSATGLPPGVSINATTGLVSGTIWYTPVNPSPGTSVSYVAVIGAANASSGDSFAATWTITDTNRLPTLGFQNTAEGATASLGMAATDDVSSDQPLSYSASGLPGGLSINATSGLITGKARYDDVPPGDIYGSYYPVVTVTDQNGGIDRRSGTWLVAMTDMMMSPGPWSGDEGTTASVNVANSLVTDTLTYSATALPPGLSINASSGLISGTVWYTPVNPSPNVTPTATYAAVVSASDGTSGQSETVSFTVTDTNRLPVVGPLSNAEEASVSLNMQATDNVSSDAPLSYSASALPPGLSIDSGSGLIEGTISLGAITTGSLSVYQPTVTVTDQHGGLDRESLTWSITGPYTFDTTEGLAYSGTVAIADASGLDGDTAAVIDWGDGTTPTGGSLDTLTGVIYGTHTYHEDGFYSVMVTLSGGGETLTVPAIGDVADASLTDISGGPYTGTPASVTSVDASGNTLSATQSVALSGVTLASFTYGVAEATVPFGVAIEWGDGSSGSGSIVEAGSGSFLYYVTAAHTYTDAGAMTARVDISTDLPDVFPVQIDVAANPAPDPTYPLAATPERLYADEGIAFTNAVLATVIDYNSAHPCHTATINWGDGGSGTAQVVLNTGTGQLDVEAGHTYAAEGAYLMTITVEDDVGHSVTVYATAYVSGAVAPELTGNGQVANAGELLQDVYLGTVRNLNPVENDAALDVQIDWGDGSGFGSVTLVPGSAEPTWLEGSHIYAEPGSYTVTLLAVDDADAGTYTTMGVSVTGGAAGAALTVQMGTFQDANPFGSAADFTSTVDWGDGSSGTAAIAADGGGITSPADYSVSGSHTWASASTYYASVDVVDDTKSVTLNKAITIGEPALQPLTYSPTATTVATSFSETIAEFTDPNYTATGWMASTYAATIDWGDGTRSAGTVTYTGSDGVFDVAGSHLFTAVKSYSLNVLVEESSPGSRNILLAGALDDADGYQGPLDLAGGAPIKWFAGTPTGTLVLATVSGVPFNITTTGFAASIDWGDGSTTTGTIVADGGGDYSIKGGHTYAAAGSYTITIDLADADNPDLDADPAEATTAASIVSVSFASVDFDAPFARAGNDPQQVLLYTVGEASVDLNTGGLRLTQPLDFDQSPGTDVGGNPALVYNSSAADPRAVIKVELDSVADGTYLPSSVQLQLTWDGAPQGWVTYSTAGFCPGQDMVFAVDQPATLSAGYGWQLAAVVTYSDPADSSFQKVVGPTILGSGTVDIASEAQSPIGPGWGIAGIEHLDFVCGGILMVNGSGDSRLFSAQSSPDTRGDGTYISPAEDFGTLVQHDDFSFTYTASDQTKWNFDENGNLISVVSPDGVERDYAYNVNGLLTQVTAADGGVTSLSYSTAGLLTTISEPGSRTVSIVRSGSDPRVFGITDEDGNTRTFGYSGSGNLVTSDEWQPYDASFGYSSAGILTSIDQGLGSVYTIVAAEANGLSGPVYAHREDLATVTDALDHTTTYGVDLRGRETSLKDALGDEQTWERNAAGEVTLYTDALGNTTASAYSAGDLTLVSNPDGSWSSYAYNSFNEVTEEVDYILSGYRTTNNSYDSVGDLTETVDPDGIATTNTWSDGLLVESDHAGRTTQYEYDGDRRLIETIDPLGRTTDYSYDAAGNPDTTVDPDGGTTATEYDGRDELTEQIDPAGDTTQTEYDAAGLVIETVDGLGLATETEYDQRGLVTEIVANAGTAQAQTTANLYDAAENETETIDPMGRETEFAYDAANRQVSTTAPLGDVTLERYDAAGNVTATVDAMSRTTLDAYNAMGEVTLVTDPMGETTRTAYDGAGDVTLSVDAMNRSTQSFFDGDGNETETIDPLGLTTANEYDPDGNVTETIDPLGRTTKTQYDLDDEATATIDALGNTTQSEYDGDGEVTATIDPLGRTTKTLYNLDDEVTATVDALGYTTSDQLNLDGETTAVVDPMGRSTKTLYNDDGDATATVDALGNTTANQYDADNELTAVVDPMGRTTKSLYNLDGEETATVDALGNTTADQLDADGETTAVVDAMGRTTKTLYNLDGEETATVDALGNTTADQLDADGETTAVVDPMGRTTKTLFNLDGEETATVDALGNTTADQLDADGETTAVVDPMGRTTKTLYNLDGEETATVDALGNTTADQLDADGETTAVVDAMGRTTKTLYNLDGEETATVDALGNTTADQLDADGETTAVVDPMGRTTKTLYNADGEETATVDALGNTTADQLDADGETTAVVDPMGRTTTTLYNADGEETATVDALGNTTADQLDADGETTAVVDPMGRTTKTLYSLDGEETATVDALGNTTADQLDADGETTAVVDPMGRTTKTLYNLDGEETATVDALGNTTADQLDADGETTAVVDPMGRTTKTLYNLDGEETATVDALGNTTADQLDADGETTAVVDPMGRTTKSLYNLDGEETASIDALGNTTADQLDADGETTAIVDPMGRTTKSLYNLDGEETATVDALGNTTADQLDADGETTAVVDPMGRTTKTLYNLDGEETATVDALGNTTADQLDADGETTTVVDPMGRTTKTLYNLDGEETATVDALGNTTANQYDADGEPTAVIDALSRTTKTLFNLDSEKTATVDALGNTTADQLDADGETTAVVDPMGRTTKSLYNLDGEETATVDGLGNTTADQLDADGETTAVVDPMGRTTKTLFNADGEETATVDALGNTTADQLDADGETTAVVDPMGRTTKTLYNLDGEETATVDALGNTTADQLDADGETTAVVDPMGRTTKTLYNLDGEETATVDALGNTTADQLDADGETTAVVDPLGRTTKTLYNADGEETATVDALGNTTADQLDADGETTAVVDPMGRTTKTLYNADGEETATVDALGNTTSDQLDADGETTAVVDAMGRTSKTLYNADGEETATVDALGNTTADQLDGDGETTAVVDALGRTTKTLYNADGEETATADGLGNTTADQLDADGETTAVVDALGHTTKTLYNADGDVTATVDALGNTTSDQMDADGDDTAIVDALGRTTKTLYNLDGEETATVDALGNTTTDQLDADGETTAVVDALGRTTKTLFNADGQVTATVDALGNTTADQLDADGETTAVVDGLGRTTKTLYNADGEETATVDGLGNTSSSQYDADGELTATVDALGDTTQNQYDADGNETLVTDASGNKTTFGYDADGEQVTMTDPLGNTQSQSYNADGQLTLTIDRDGRTISDAYDADGHTTLEVWYAAGGGSPTETSSWDYDADGRLVEASNANGSYSLGYDTDGEVTAVSEPFGLSMSFGYDGDGNRTLVTDSLGGTTQSAYDADSELLSEIYSQAGVPTLAVNQAYNSDGQATTQTRTSDDGTGPVTVVAGTTAYDADGEMTSQGYANVGGTSIAGYSYAYNTAGEMTVETDNGVAQSFTYDASGQLTGDGTSSLSYDATGNRAGTGYIIGPDNEVLSDGTWDYRYDADGNETEKVNKTTGEAWVYGYDNKNELISAQDWTSDPLVYGTAALEKEIDYKYDVFGNLLEEDLTTYVGLTGTSSVVARYAVDGWNPATPSGVGNENWNVWADLTGSNTLQTRYLRGDNTDQLFGRVDSSGNVYWTLNGSQGSVQVVVDNSCNVKDVIVYDAFGNITSETNSAYRGNYAWTGRELDVETNLQYNNARWYDSASGRWISQDPLGFDAGDSNLYRYVHNAPTDATDPSGMWELRNDGRYLMAYPNDGDNLAKLIRLGFEKEGVVRQYVDQVLSRKNLNDDWLDAMYAKIFNDPAWTVRAEDGPLNVTKIKRDTPPGMVPGPGANAEVVAPQSENPKSDGSDLQWISQAMMASLVQNKLAHVAKGTGVQQHRVIITPYGKQIRAFDYVESVNPSKIGATEWSLARSYDVAPVNDANSLPALLATFDTDAYAKKLANFTTDEALANGQIKGLESLIVAINMVPGGASADAITRGDWVNASISFVGDVATVGAWRAASIAGKAANAGARAAMANRALVRFQAVDAAIAVTRVGQSGYAVLQGENGQAAAYLGEAMLRIFGIAYARRAARARQVVLGTGEPNWVVRNPSNAASIDAAIDNAANRLRQGSRLFAGEADAAVLLRGNLVQPQQGFRDIIIHAHTNIGPGEPLPTFFINTAQGMVPVSTERLATVIRSLNLPQGQGVRLIACGGGSHGMEGVNLASELARLTERRILASDAPIGITVSGQLRQIDPVAGWRIMNPNGSTSPLVRDP